MIRIVLFWKIFCPGQKNFRQGSAKLKYRWLQSSRLKMSRYSLFCVYRKTLKKVWKTLTKFDYPKNASRQNLLAEKLLYFHCLFFWEKRFTFLSHYFHLKNLQFKIIHIKNITNRITISPKYSFILYPNQHCFKLFTT